eukprot:COSAG06_NODE_1248_length_10110_cov_19.070223_6_plen_86_part_00
MLLDQGANEVDLASAEDGAAVLLQCVLHRTALCCAVLRCAALCCAALCCAVLWCAVLCCGVLRCGVLCCAGIHPLLRPFLCCKTL